MIDRERLRSLGPFGLVLDVGGNLGDFAELALEMWPAARIVSFEPIPLVAERNRIRAAGRWQVMEVAISDREGTATLNVCRNQHSASTLQEPGSVRAQRFGIADQFVPVEVETVGLETIVQRLGLLAGPTHWRTLLKVDVEGHELPVLQGAPLDQVETVVCEVQNAADVFVGAATPGLIDALLHGSGLWFSGLLDALHDPQGRVVQFDGIWTR